jgi:hypothetical protein
MLIHPWDATLGPDEWRAWLAGGHDFGQLVVNAGPDQLPMVIPTHFAADPVDLPDLSGASRHQPGRERPGRAGCSCTWPDPTRSGPRSWPVRWWS